MTMRFILILLKGRIFLQYYANYNILEVIKERKLKELRLLNELLLISVIIIIIIIELDSKGHPSIL